ncbi:hypothetical protein HJC23_008445 [Cyclotella cryptica]|uniref:Uncharacterized protein n=1 Tax=Cyclotella cryptica TaxID=29204 RepID=A0ABD3R3Z2_9STRA|eukprot:CCRYP_001154-RA/>CCRYP_001154-RA protein AED:0.04 eAED:0.04 QI:196/1/1/1/0/0/2/143/260
MMKSLAFAFALLAASTSGFAPIQTNKVLKSTSIFSTEAPEEVTSPVEEAPVAQSTAAALAANSASLPFMPRPQFLDGSLAGDVGFDPLNFAKSSSSLLNYREAEVKHARLAMLAAAGWPLSEVFDKKIAAAFNMAPVLDSSDRVPSLLNGGLGKISPAYWVGCLGVAALIDVIGTLRTKAEKDMYLPGDFGLRLGYPENEEGQKWMQTAEIKNGRLAMIAVVGFAIQEFVSKQGVVDETPLFFFPIVETLHKYANSGYIQ